MAILVINCGSTSVKAAVIDPSEQLPRAQITVGRLGGSGPAHLKDGEGRQEQLPSGTHQEALAIAIARLQDVCGDAIAAVGHRVVHGGQQFHHAVTIDDHVEQTIEDLSRLAPLHNPINLMGIRETRRILAEVPHVAVFDTAFHATLPRRAQLYAIDRETAARLEMRRFGFHGTSHQFVAMRTAEFLGESPRDLRIITCHLGGGCSVCAVEFGRSVETSMGLTPLEGLVMGTRSGDLDPGLLFHWARMEDLSLDELEERLNKRSGLAGLSGTSGDMRDLEAAAAEGHVPSQEALQVFCHRLRKYIGAYTALMGGVDAIVFTGGIGENSQTVRHRVASRLDYLGARFDEVKNRAVSLSLESPVADLSQPHSRVRLLAVATDEMRAIAQQTQAVVQAKAPLAPKAIPIAISARHVHLTQAAVETLFGEGHELTPLKGLSQPGQFACEEQVTLVGPRRTLAGVRVLGPARSKNQVEIARTDEFHLGIDAPVRPSGQIAGTPGITLLGTEGRSLELTEGVICALRHIHMTPEDAKEFGVQAGDRVEVEVGAGGGRQLTFGDVLIRVRDTYRLEMHIDTDEGNAAELRPRDEGELAPSGGEATLRRAY